MARGRFRRMRTKIRSYRKTKRGKRTTKIFGLSLPVALGLGALAYFKFIKK